MTKHDRQMLWRTYQTLLPHQKTIMRLSAVIGDDIQRGTFVQILAASRSRAPDGKAWSGRSADELRAGLRAQGLLEKDLTCAASIRHQIARDAAEGEQSSVLLHALDRALPRSDHEKRNDFFYLYHRHPLTEDRDLFRRVRIAVYANDQAEFVRLCAIFDRDDEGAAGTALRSYLARLPPDIEWLERREPAIREALITGLVLALLQNGSIGPDAAAAVTQFTQSAVSPSSALYKALLWRDVLAGNFDLARERSAALLTEDAVTAVAADAVMQFLTGQNRQSIASFREALKRFRNATHIRKCVLPGGAGLFHVLALLREHEPRHYAEIRNLLDAARSSPNAPETGYQALGALLEIASGDDEKAAQAIANVKAKGPLSGALLSLARLHLDSEARRSRISSDEAEFHRLAPHLPLVARIHAEILAKVSGQTDRSQDVLRGMGMEDVISFTEIIGFKPKWERAFEQLTAFLRPDSRASGPSAAPQVSKRLVFMLDPRTRGIEALEQACKGGTWNAGRPVAMKRLQEQDSKLDYLTPADRRVLQTIRKASAPRWYGGGEYWFDEYRSLLALIGHPNVFDARHRGRHVDLISYPCELVVSETSKGYAFTLSHHASEPTVFIEEETPGRWRVIEVPANLVKLQVALGRNGLIVPYEMRARVIPLLRAEHPTLPIRSELPDIEVPAIEGVTTPVLRLRRAGDGLSVAIVVRPLGPDGPSYVPGHGGHSVLAVANGVRQRVNRDLAAESAAAQRLVRACRTLQPWNAGPHEWHIEELEAALAFLEEMQALEQTVAIEWPDGEALRVTRLVDAKRLSLKVTTERDWFEITGRITVDEDLVVDMEDVLARLDKAHGRFVPLDGGRLLALTADFKRKLQHLNTISDESSRGRKLHSLGVVTIEGLVEEAGSVDADQRWRDLVSRIRATGEHHPSIPSTLQAELRDYQREGFVWLSRLARLEMGACLADDMGLGKTVQAIALLLEQAERGPSLVIAPTSVCHNWEMELARFAPTLGASRLSAAADRRACVEALGAGSVLISSYGLLHQDEDALIARSWNVIVFDEAQNLKNVETKRAQASQKLGGRIRLALSGTPIENYLDELWSLFNTINPGLLGSRERFARRFAAPIERSDAEARNALRTLIRPFILRRSKSAVLAELPPRTELVIEVAHGQEERAFYEALRRQALANLAALDGPSGQRKIHILAEITRLRRACCHPALIDSRSTIESAKLKSFLELIEELLRNRHKALVFSQFIGHLDKVRAELDRRAVRYQYIDGAVPAQQRAARVAAFQAGDGELFLISLKAGGTGLNLTAADYVIHLDPWWNPAVEDQASDRAHRIGQTRPVTVYRLIVADTIEERILDLHRHKRDIAADLLEGAETSGRLSEDELIALIRQ
jgi:superfamily II DNA or RNA helicase